MAGAHGRLPRSPRRTPAASRSSSRRRASGWWRRTRAAAAATPQHRRRRRRAAAAPLFRGLSVDFELLLLLASRRGGAMDFGVALEVYNASVRLRDPPRPSEAGGEEDEDVVVVARQRGGRGKRSGGYCTRFLSRARMLGADFTYSSELAGALERREAVARAAWLREQEGFLAAAAGAAESSVRRGGA